MPGPGVGSSKGVTHVKHHTAGQIKTVLIASGMVISTLVFAEEPQDCTGGTPSPERCLQQRRAAEVELLSLNRALLKKKTAELKKLDGGGRAAELPLALKRSHQAWVNFRHAQCTLEHLIDGTTLQYRAAVVEACKLGLTHDRIKDIRRQTEL